MDRTTSRAISPVIGGILIIAIVVVLAGVTAGFVLSLSDSEEVGRTAVLSLDADADSDELTLTHKNGDSLYADQTRIVWEIDDQRFTSKPTDSHTELSAGLSTTFTFDGTTSASGTWTSYNSPGDIDIEAGDTVRIQIYDTSANKPVFDDTFTIENAGSSSPDGVSVTINEYCAGSDVGENENENENENEDDSGDYTYTYEYDYDYEDGKYRYEYDYEYDWSEDAVQNPNPDPDPDPDDSLSCVDPTDEPEPNPQPNPQPDPP